jgi:antitoxin ParD1/3/4
MRRAPRILREDVADGHPISHFSAAKLEAADLVRICAEIYKGRMAQMNISIPDKLKGWAEQRVAEGRYSSTSDYVRDLVRRDQENEEKLRRLQAAIDEGRASGVSERDPFEYLAELRAGLAGGSKDAAPS